MLHGRCRQAQGTLQLPRFPLFQCLKLCTWLMLMTGRHRESFLPKPTWQPLLGSGQESPVLVPFHVQRSASSPFPSEEGQAHLETSVPGKAQCHCQLRYITVPLKEITIDPTALLPMLFAGDSQGFPCQLGSHTARLFLHQMARPTPSGCRMPPGEEALTSICLAFSVQRTAGSEITGPTTLQ